MAAGFAHLLELPNKIRLPRDAYLTVQQIYRGWALLGIAVIAAIASTLGLAIMVRHERRMFTGAIVALSCLVATQIIFWTFTYPVNQITANWTVAPENWKELRAQWEYSHAVAACLDFAALIALVWSTHAGPSRSTLLGSPPPCQGSSLRSTPFGASGLDRSVGRARWLAFT